MLQPASTVRRREAGFTVAEMMVTLLILVLVMVGVLSLFDLAAKISRVQVSVTDMQQSLRSGQYEMARMVRMAGRGSVPYQGRTSALTPEIVWGVAPIVAPQAITVGVANNVPAGTFLDAPANTVRVLQGTDVLTVRGVFSSPVYSVVPGSFVLNAGNGRGSFQVASIARPGVPVPQTLDPLRELLVAPPGDPLPPPEPIILVSAFDDSFYHIVEIDPATSAILNPDLITVGFRSSPLDGPRIPNYWQLSGGNWDTAAFLGAAPEVAFAGILEEYRYFVRDQREDPGDQTSPLVPTLVRARVYPAAVGGAVVAHGNDAANLAVPITDNIADLQIALGIERSGAIGVPDTAVPDEADITTTAANNDEWLFNHPGDAPADASWQNGQLFWVRLSTTSIASRPDRDFQANRYPGSPINGRLEDHQFVIPDYRAASQVTADRSLRRRTLRTVVDLRNLR